nr:MAG TPA: hypothetical protein [Caudoviricetes sp.]
MNKSFRLAECIYIRSFFRYSVNGRKIYFSFQSQNNISKKYAILINVHSTTIHRGGSTPPL